MMTTKRKTTPTVPDGHGLSFDDVRALISGWVNTRPIEEFIAELTERSQQKEAATAAQKKIRGKNMSRRTGQLGHIEKSGNWWVVRWWMDVKGQQERSHMRAKICPIKGPGSLSESAIKRVAKDIVNASGANSQAHFDRVNRVGCITFSEQAVYFFQETSTRKRLPVSAATLDSRRACVKKWLNPMIADLPLSEVNNGVLKRVVKAMADADLKPVTINDYVKVLKAIVASAVDSEGNQLYPRTWNDRYADIPVVDKSKQNVPCFKAETVSGLTKYKEERERTLFCLCAAAGLRLGEALGLEIGKHISADCLVLYIEQTVRRRRIQNSVKTAAGLRAIDLHPEIAAMLLAFIGTRTSGLLFCTSDGKPLSADKVRTAHLYPALKQLGYINPSTKDHRAGSHAFRRYRNTFLRNRTACPEGLRAYWMGHATKSMGDLYDKIKEDEALRREWAERCGYGFILPPAVPPVPKIVDKNERKKAA